MKRFLAFLGVLFSLGLLGLGALAYFLYSSFSPAAGIVYIERGLVEVNLGKGWQPATNEMDVKQGALVRTGDGEATIVLLGGELLHLEPHTEVGLTHVGKKKIDLTQATGETWNKVTKLSGVAEYTIQTPTTVATVRGTEFLLAQDEVNVFDGDVEYRNKKKAQAVRVKANKRVRADAMIEEDIPEQRRARHRQIQERDVNALRRERAREVQRKLVIMSKVGISEEKVDYLLTNVDAGEMNEDEVYEKIPAPLKPQVERIYRLTKQIKALTPKETAVKEPVRPRSADTETAPKPVVRQESVTQEISSAK
ncbi:FecR domain-containing protein [Candidatus Woesearchaeota archaeon]|nr:FecR domain-containing protein [Candidatus Woesearchaeota archaeon]